jgi:RNA polymerase sigma-54 factor
MSQQLVMTPQLQQAIKLLQLSRLELADTINQELTENPMLERLELGDGGEAEGRTTEAKAEGGAEAAGDAGANGESSSNGERPGGETEPGGDGDYGGGDFSDRSEERSDAAVDWERFVENYNQYSYSPGTAGVRYGDDDLPTLEQTVASRSNLYDHLEWQLGLTQLTEAECQAGLEIIGEVNEAGFFAGDLAEVAERTGLEVDEVEAVLEVIQEFDPVGVASRTLRECLLRQALHYYPKDDVVHAIIDRHLENLEKRNVQAICKDLDLDLNDLAAAAQVIGCLEPRPGRGYSSETTHYITPDVYVYKVGDDYQVVLNDDGLPKLKISSFYQNHLKGGRASGAEKSFIQDKFRSAVWLIRSIHQRQNTIRKVTESIVRFQREFLDQGVSSLRPLILRDIADDVGMHESTVSRVTTNKYVHTPQGIFELKYFFNSRISSSSGEDLASESVKQRIKQLINKEDPKHPLSDQNLCEILASEGTEIARRTVAKYRETLGIESSSKRKKLF